MRQILHCDLSLVKCELLGSEDHLLFVGNTRPTPHSPTNKKCRRSFRLVDEEEDSLFGSPSISSKAQTIVPSGGDEDDTQGCLLLYRNEFRNAVDKEKRLVEIARHDLLETREDSHDDDDDFVLRLCDGKDEDDSLALPGKGGAEREPHFVNDVSVLSLAALGKSFVVAVGGNRRLRGSLSVCELSLSSGENSVLAPSRDLSPSFCSSAPAPSVFTAVAHCCEKNLLFLGEENGTVRVLDLQAMREVRSFVADSAGLVALQCSGEGQLVSCGLSDDSPLRVFDINRTKGDGSVSHACASSLFRRKQVSFSSSAVNSSSSFSPPRSPSLSQRTGIINSSSRSQSTSWKSPVRSPLTTVSQLSLHSPSRSSRLPFSLLEPAMSCMSVHPQQRKVLAGDSAGRVHSWDIRMDAMVSFQPHSTIVTSVAAHPLNQDVVLSCSKDGTIKALNAQVCSPSVQTIFQQDSDTFNGFTVDAVSNSVFVTTQEGRAWKIPLFSLNHLQRSYLFSLNHMFAVDCGSLSI